MNYLNMLTIFSFSPLLLGMPTAWLLAIIYQLISIIIRNDFRRILLQNMSFLLLLSLLTVNTVIYPSSLFSNLGFLISISIFICVSKSFAVSQRFLPWLIVFLAINCSLSLLQFLSLDLPLIVETGRQIKLFNQAQGLFSEPSALALFAGISLCASSYSSLLRNPSVSIKSLSAITFLSLTCCLLSLSITGFVFIFIALVVSLTGLNYKIAASSMARLRISKYLPIACALCILLAFAFSRFESYYYARYFEIVDLVNQSKLSSSSGVRVYGAFDNSLPLITKNPLFGYGADWQEINKVDNISHNLFLELLVRYGVIGLLITLAIIVKSINNPRRHAYLITSVVIALGFADGSIVKPFFWLSLLSLPSLLNINLPRDKT